MYDNAEYASSRLTDSVVRIKKTGKPVWVMDCKNTKDGIVVRVTDMATRLNTRYVDLFDLDLTPVPLGFCNSYLGLAYLARKPMRKDWKQGFRYNNTNSVYGVAIKDISYREVENTILNIYPSLDRALDISINTGIPIAFDRKFAICGDEVLYKYFGPVGEFHLGEIHLQDKFHFLSEEVEVLKRRLK